MGVSVVRGLGSGVPLYSAGAGRSGLCEGTADPAASGMVHAPQWAATRLRVGFGGRESAGACVGGVARLQNRETASRRCGSRFPRKSFSQTAAQFYVVGEP